MSNLLAAKIKAARKSANLTQAQLAEKLNLSRGAVTQWESMTDETRTTPTLNALQRLAQIVDVPLEWLMDEAQSFKSIEEARHLTGPRWSKPRSGGVPNHLRSRATLNHLGFLSERGSASSEEQEFNALVQTSGADDIDGEPLDERARLKYSAEFARRFEETESPHRMSNAFWKAVEFAVLSARPDLQDAFEVPVACPGIKLYADFFNDGVVAEFKYFPLFRNHHQWTIQVCGQLLMTEALAGRPLRKQLLLWTPDNNTIGSAERRLQVLEQMGGPLASMARLRLREYADNSGEAGDHKLMQIQEAGAAMKIEVHVFRQPAEAAKHLLSLA
jgi:transcriptional regulator with XRE-family HTH domain